MEHNILVGLASIVVLGILAQWVAWRLGLPSIVLLLLSGFIAGPVTGFIHPDALLGDLLVPVVSASVAIILFEGGLTLRIGELGEIGKVVRNLISVGVVVTWLLSAAAAYFILGLDLSLALLLGSILTVTGPTVIIPLLRFVGPVGQVGSILRWEGILIDPVGATLAVLVFEAILAGDLPGATTTLAIVGFLRTALVGAVIGLVGAALLYYPLKRYWIPDFLDNAATLTLVVAVFALSNQLQAESGLLAVTVMGIVLANQTSVPVKHIAEFKENLQPLLLAALFILLSARLDLGILRVFDLRGLLFLLFLILVARPLGVLLSTIGSTLETRERIFLAWIAPRGVVAAAVSSIFALGLVAEGFAAADQLVAYTFLVIVGTVTVYGLTARPLARWLGLTRGTAQGLLIVGAHDWAREIAQAVQEEGYEVLMVDSNPHNLRAARMQDLRTYHGNILDEYAHDEIDLMGLGRLIALTPNDEVNSLAALHFREIFGRAEVFQLATGREQDAENESVSRVLRGRVLFGAGITFSYISRRVEEGAVIKKTPLTDEFDHADYKALYGEAAVPLFLVTREGTLEVFTKTASPKPQPGSTIIGLVDPVEDEIVPVREPGEAVFSRADE